MAARKKGARRKRVGIINRNQRKQLEQIGYIPDGNDQFEPPPKLKKERRKGGVYIWPQ